MEATATGSDIGAIRTNEVDASEFCTGTFDLEADRRLSVMWCVTVWSVNGWHQQSTIFLSRGGHTKASQTCASTSDQTNVRASFHFINNFFRMLDKRCDCRLQQKSIQVLEAVARYLLVQ